MTETKQLTVIDTLKKMQPEFKSALPEHINAERFVRNAVTAVNSNPDLLGADVDRRSLLSATMKAAQDGLILDNKEAALVIFKTKDGKKVQYMAMVAGLLKKMRNSGEISNISHGLVYQKEFDSGRFKYTKGDNESLVHDPILFEDKGKLIGVYAVVTLKDGSKIRDFMDMTQIAKVRAASKTGNSEYGPWNTWFEEMCIKSVLRRVYKLCPSSSDIDSMFAGDDPDDEVTVSIAPVSTPEKETRTAKAVKGMLEDLDGEVVTVVSDGTDKPPL